MGEFIRRLVTYAFLGFFAIEENDCLTQLIVSDRGTLFFYVAWIFCSRIKLVCKDVKFKQNIKSNNNNNFFIQGKNSIYQENCSNILS